LGTAEQEALIDYLSDKVPVGISIEYGQWYFYLIPNL
jgi:hypothetical protein